MNSKFKMTFFLIIVMIIICYAISIGNCHGPPRERDREDINMGKKVSFITKTKLLPVHRPIFQHNTNLCRTANMWNILPAHIFPSSYNLASFKRSFKKH